MARPKKEAESRPSYPILVMEVARQLDDAQRRDNEKHEEGEDQTSKVKIREFEAFKQRRVLDRIVRVGNGDPRDRP